MAALLARKALSPTEASLYPANPTAPAPAPAPEATNRKTLTQRGVTSLSS